MVLHHVEINVSELETSKKFWRWLLCDRLGYQVFQEWRDGISFKHDQTYLVFVQADPTHAAAGYHRRRIGLNHLAFHAQSKELVDQFAQDIDQKGIKALYGSPIHDGDNYSLFFEDSDRIKIEIVYSDKNR